MVHSEFVLVGNHDKIHLLAELRNRFVYSILHSTGSQEQRFCVVSLDQRSCLEHFIERGVALDITDPDVLSYVPEVVNILADILSRLSPAESLFAVPVPLLGFVRSFPPSSDGTMRTRRT